MVGTYIHGTWYLLYAAERMLNHWVMSLVSSHHPFCVSHLLPGLLPFSLFCSTSCSCAHWLPNNFFLPFLPLLSHFLLGSGLPDVPHWSKSPNPRKVQEVPCLSKFGCACGWGWLCQSSQSAECGLGILKPSESRCVVCGQASRLDGHKHRREI